MGFNGELARSRHGGSLIRFPECVELRLYGDPALNTRGVRVNHLGMEGFQTKFCSSPSVLLLSHFDCAVGRFGACVVFNVYPKARCASLTTGA